MGASFCPCVPMKDEAPGGGASQLAYARVVGAFIHCVEHRRQMPTRRLSVLLALIALPALAAPAAAADYVPGEVIVKYRDGTSASVEASIEQEAGTETETVLPGGSEQLQIADGETVEA